MPDQKTIKQWIEDVNDYGQDLTSWEIGFMDSITDQFERSCSLSERQIEILERIYSEKTP